MHIEEVLRDPQGNIGLSSKYHLSMLQYTILTDVYGYILKYVLDRNA